MVTSRYARVMTVYGGYLYAVFRGRSRGEMFLSLSALFLKPFPFKDISVIYFILHVRTYVVPVQTNINGSAAKWSRHNYTSVLSFGGALVRI